MCSDRGAFLDVVAALGRGMADSAIWHDGRCTWVGPVSVEETPAAGDRATHAALGPGLYAGTSGVALFLAEAARKLGDDCLRTTALGAIRHALDHARRADAARAGGLHAGPVGIAYAAARVARLLGAEAVLAGAREALQAWRRDGVAAQASDMASGCAGTVIGLVALADLIAESWLVEAATSLGEVLLTRADITSAGWSWPAPRQHATQNLCGYAHGAAGIGHALVELSAATGDMRFREAGARAFDYLRSRIDPRTGTWPDLRGVARSAGQDAVVPASDSWCHGAPGIALSLVRTTRILGTDAVRDDAHVGIAATRRLVAGLLTHGLEDFSLCHGAAGAADALLYGEDPSGLATDIGLLGIEQYHRPGASFPCGVPQGQTPGLFPGLAGIALFYLRLGDRTVPTPLLVHPRHQVDNGYDASVQSNGLGTAGKNSRGP